MREVTAYFKPHRLDPVVSALHELPRFPGFTVFDAYGQGHGRGAGGHYAEAEAVAETIAGAAHSGRPGDGLVAIEPVATLRRIRDAGGGA